MTPVGERDYVLGTHDAEMERLGLQHRVWRPRVLAAWQRAGLTVGQTVVDLGCGPGYATVDLADIVGPTGHVHAIDRSSRFLSALTSRARALGLAHVSTYEHDLDQDGWPSVAADLVWCRWVAAFVRDPRAFVDRLCPLVKPQGAVVLYEYLDYAAWRLLPDAPSFDQFVAAVIATWRQAGGEPDIGRALPGWLEASGFRIVSLVPHIAVIAPTEYFWQWPRAFVQTGLARLVDLGAMDAAGAEAVWREFLGRETSPHVRMVTPTVLEIVAVRY
jgi:SAM-dependent methyltransferase